jgi:hypothetical protein
MRTLYVVAAACVMLVAGCSPADSVPLGRPGEMDFIPPSRGMGIDATRENKITEFPIPAPSKPTMELLNKVGKRWEELGLS